MRGGVGRAVVIGALLAVLALLIGGGLLVSGAVELPRDGAPVERVLVIGTVPLAEGGDAAAFALVIDSRTEKYETLDTLAPTTVAGTSATTARDAFAYGGGDSVAAALSAQTNGEALPWVVLPASLWARLLDADGGVDATVERGISAFIDGGLTVVEPGRRSLTGTEAVALAASADFIADSASGQEVLRTIAEGIGSALAGSSLSLSELVTSGEAESDIAPARLPGGQP